MFVNTGSRKVKALTHIIFPYECHEPCYSTKKINILSFEIQRYLSIGSNEDFFERMKRENEQFFNVMTKDQLFLLIDTLRKLNGVLLFSYDSPNKRKKIQRVSFYVVPKSAYGFSRTNPKFKNKPCGNERFFLVSDARLPDEMVSGCWSEKEKEYKGDDAVIHFDVRNTRSKHYSVSHYQMDHKNAFGQVITKYLNFDLALAKSLPHGLHKATLNGVNCYLYSDKILLGDDKNPKMCLLDLSYLSDEQVDSLICKHDS